MKCYSEINYFKRTITIDKKPCNVFVESKKSTLIIDRIVAAWFLEKQRKNIFIDKGKYKVISVYVPFFSDWVMLQNDSLPVQGEYFLN